MLNVLVLLFAVPAGAAAPPSPIPVCREATDRIDSILKEVSVRQVDEMTDDSAPRATMRGTQDSASMAEIQANLMVMEAHRCAAFPHAIDARAYFGPALECRVTRTKDPFTDNKFNAATTAACDQSKWIRR